MPMHCAIISWRPLKNTTSIHSVAAHDSHGNHGNSLCVRFLFALVRLTWKRQMIFYVLKQIATRTQYKKGRQQNKTKTHSKRIKLAFVFCRNQATKCCCFCFINDGLVSVALFFLLYIRNPNESESYRCQ